MRQALLKAYGAEGVPPAHEDYYVISATGLPMGMGGLRRDRSDSGDAQAMQQQAARMLEMVRQSTTLNIKGKQKLQAAKVEAGQRGGVRVLYFLFPRDPKIGPEDKELDFESKMGPIEVKGKFKPKDMLYAGKLEL